MSTQIDDLARLSRFEALFELSSEINASTEIEQVGRLFARRLKYVADAFSWRYLRLEHQHGEQAPDQRIALVIDGYRGQAVVESMPCRRLCALELNLWEAKKARFLEGDDLESAKPTLPEHFRREDIVQVYVHPKFQSGNLQSLLLFSKKRQAFNELDIKFLALASQFFHNKIYLLWEEKKLRDLEKAYLEREIMLRESDKLATLGKLSAGVAHELNNPAAAVQRGAAQLRSEIDRLDRLQRELNETGLSEAQDAALEKLVELATQRAREPSNLDPLTRSDLEGDIERWLGARGIDEPWACAPTMAAIGLGVAELTALAEELSGEQLAVTVAFLSGIHSTRSLMEEVRTGAGRISEIVKALKSYTYLDQAPKQSVDLHEGLDDTLVILRSKLKKGIAVRRDYDDALPRIEAMGSELNQVWTNILDNAIDAMHGQGNLVLKTCSEGPWAVVEIIDDGPGIPEDVRAKIFDPFVTTKPPGEGTGLGLNICHNIIVQKHHGTIDVRSKPGETAFVVKLPLAAITSKETVDVQTSNTLGG